METFLKEAENYYFSREETEYYTALLKRREAELHISDSKGRKLEPIVSRLSEISTSLHDFSKDIIKIGDPEEISFEQKEIVKSGLLELWPWRKGPFEIFGIFIDTEWKSNLKWDRVRNQISPLYRRHVLDIGSSSGYYIFRMLEHDPGFVMGLEPYSVYYYQFKVLKSLTGIKNITTLPIRFEEMYIPGKKFNTVFCMGVLYHRISPIDFLRSIRLIMARNGELVLETLILDGDEHICLYPESRYAKMNNVYFIPTLPVLKFWIKKAGFSEVSCIDISHTTEDEQRNTDWVRTESLKDFLDPQNKKKTVEGYQAPLRAVLIAKV